MGRMKKNPVSIDETIRLHVVKEKGSIEQYSEWDWEDEDYE